MDQESYISVFVKDMRVNVRIGLLPEERLQPQALDVSVALFAGAEYLAQAADGDYIDYARVHDFVLGWEEQEHVEMLESLAQQLVDFAFALDARVTGVKLSLSKPDIFDAAKGAGIEVFFRR
jgi:FolB domain-containing protein